MERRIKLPNLNDASDNFLKLIPRSFSCLFASQALISAEASQYYCHRNHNQDCFAVSQDVMVWSFIGSLQTVPVSFLEYDKCHCCLASWDPIYFNLLLGSWKSDTVWLSSVCLYLTSFSGTCHKVLQKALSEAFILIFIQTERQRIVCDPLYWLKTTGGTLHCRGKEKWMCESRQHRQSRRIWLCYRPLKWMALV